MKQVIIFVIGGVVGVVVMLLLCTSGNMPIDCSCAPEMTVPGDSLPPGQGSVIDTSEFNFLVTAFQGQTPILPVLSDPTVVEAPDPGETPPESPTNIPLENLGKFGGRIGALALLQMLNGLENPEDKFIDYRFGFKQDGAFTKTYLMLYRKRPLETGETEPLIIRSPDTDASFCPNMCGLD